MNLKLINIAPLNCHYCGSEPIAVIDNNEWSERYRVECPNGCMAVKSHFMISAIEIWNESIKELRKLDDPNVPKVNFTSYKK